MVYKPTTFRDGKWGRPCSRRRTKRKRYLLAASSMLDKPIFSVRLSAQFETNRKTFALPDFPSQFIAMLMKKYMKLKIPLSQQCEQLQKMRTIAEFWHLQQKNCVELEKCCIMRYNELLVVTCCYISFWFSREWAAWSWNSDDFGDWWFGDE